MFLLENGFASRVSGTARAQALLFLWAFAGSAIGYEENEKGREHQTSTHYETYPKTVWQHDASISQQRTIKDTTLVSASSIESH